MNHRAQQVIFDHHKWINSWVGTFKPAPHLFGNLCDTVPAGSFDPVAPFDERKSQVNDAPMCTSQFCLTHGGHCSLTKPVDLDMSGLPCEDNSRANFKRRFLHGNFGSVYLIWAKYHRRMRTPVLLLENTPELWMVIIVVHLLVSNVLFCIWGWQSIRERN